MGVEIRIYAILKEVWDLDDSFYINLKYYSKVPNKRRDGIVVDSGKFYKI